MTGRIDRLIGAIRAYGGPPIRLMEVCGTHTHAISTFGIPALLPGCVSLISGPGCPVCVTPSGYIERAAEIALRPGCTVLSYGDLMRVPGNGASLAEAKAAGGSVTLMYSPMDAIGLAKRDPDRLFVVTAVGFETTLPLYALLIDRMREARVENIRLLTSLKALIPALHWIGQNNPGVHGFIGPGHVSAILGYGAYAPVCEAYGLPVAVAGFSFEHLIAAIHDLIRQVSQGRREAHNLYPGVVTEEGNAEALALVRRFFARTDSVWRGLGAIRDSGYVLRGEYAAYDAGSFDAETESAEPDGCLCGRVIIGRARPVDCPHFGAACAPERPLGPCMVSGEGACRIWHAAGREK